MNYQTNSPYIISTASGKGGVGKSISSVNIAEQIKNLGYKTAIIDADLGFSNCSTLLNEFAPGSVYDVMQGTCGVSDIFLTTKSGITLVTGSDEPDAEITDQIPMYNILDRVIRILSKDHDFILIDTPAGSSDLSLWALDRSDMCLLILIDEPTVISDVYRFCKFVLSIDPFYPFGVVVNMAKDTETANDILNRFNKIMSHFLKRELPYVGHIPYDEFIKETVQNQVPITIAKPGHPVSAHFANIAKVLVGYSDNPLMAKLA